MRTDEQPIRISLFAPNGRMGQAIATAAEQDPDFEIEIEQMFSRLMGEKVEPRRQFIEAHAKQALNVDWHY